MELSDHQIIEDIIGTMTKYGYNCDKSNLSTNITLLLETDKEYRKRLEEIHWLTDLTNNFIG